MYQTCSPRPELLIEVFCDGRSLLFVTISGFPPTFKFERKSPINQTIRMSSQTCVRRKIMALLTRIARYVLEVS